MDRHPRNVPAYRSVAGLEDVRDLRAAIAAALGEHPVDESRLRDAIWPYVGTEREAGSTPGRIIDAITDLVDAARIGPTAARLALHRSAILWCVEAYFGHPDGDVFDTHAGAHAGAHATTEAP